MKTIHVSCESDAGVNSVLKKSVTKLSPYERIGLLTTAQHLRKLGEAASFLEKQGKTPVLGGQILGCNTRNAEGIREKVDAFLYIGSGRFHPDALIRLGKPVITANPYSGSVEALGEEELRRFEKEKKHRLMKAAEANAYGILVSTKTGQFNLAEAERLRKRINEKGRRAFIFAGQEINPGRLLGYRIDAWVNTACPRITEDAFEKPVLNPEELVLLL